MGHIRHRENITEQIITLSTSPLVTLIHIKYGALNRPLIGLVVDYGFRASSETLFTPNLLLALRALFEMN
jgi:hypothetical protein